MTYPDELNALIDGFRRFPGVGKRSAERMAMAMLKWERENLTAFGNLIAALPESLDFCPDCGNLVGGGKECQFCGDARRNASQICVVEDVAQLFVIESSGSYRGLYHVLGGKLSPLTNRTEEDLNIAKLGERLGRGGVKELIIALGNDVESRATAFFLADKFGELVESVTVPAQGLPAGANLSCADNATIGIALTNRRSLG